jgi:hypothetical protein
MTELQDIYDTLIKLGFCDSQSAFSRDWLGRSGDYFAYLKNSGGSPDLSAIGMLIGRLKTITSTSNDSRFWEERAMLRTALVSARVLYVGEYELACVPPWQRVPAA